MSISLAPSAVEQHLVGGVATETNTHAALVSMTVDYQAGAITWVFATGTVANGSIQVGQRGSQTSVTVNLGTGIWQNSQNGTTGVIPPGGLSILNNFLRTARNGIESAAIGQSIVNGTQVPW